VNRLVFRLRETRGGGGGGGGDGGGDGGGREREENVRDDASPDHRLVNTGYV
jgi:hypothetical protein